MYGFCLFVLVWQYIFSEIKRVKVTAFSKEKLKFEKVSLSLSTLQMPEIKHILTGKCSLKSCKQPETYGLVSFSTVFVF